MNSYNILLNWLKMQKRNEQDRQKVKHLWRITRGWKHPQRLTHENKYL